MTQVDIIRAVQSIANPVLDVVFGAITALGSEGAFFMIVALMFWTVSKALAIRVGVLVVLSAFANSALKDAFHLPRPSPDDVRVIYAETAGGYGFPSGHAQAATVFWGYLARTMRRRSFAVAAAVVVLLIGLSRVYLGVHFPADVIGGFAFGAAILAAYVAALDWLDAPGRARRGIRLGAWLAPLAVIAPFGLLLLYRSTDAFKMVGLLAGLAIGCLVEGRYVRMEERAPFRQQLLRAAIGLAVVVALRAGLKAVFAPEGPILAMVRYAAMALWISLGAPFVFVRALGGARKPG